LIEKFLLCVVVVSSFTGGVVGTPRETYLTVDLASPKYQKKFILYSMRSYSERYCIQIKTMLVEIKKIVHDIDTYI